MEELSRMIQDKVSSCTLFVGGIDLVDEHGVDDKLDIWRGVLESNGFRLSRSKTQYMECKFSMRRDKDGVIVKLDCQEILKVILITWTNNT
jgi:hypothetical protein